MGQRSIRFPDELEVRLVAAAKRDGRTFSNYVLHLLEGSSRVPPLDSLGPSPHPEVVKTASRVHRGAGGVDSIPRDYGSVDLALPLKRGSAIAMNYRCPVPECERRFGSPQAVCPSHGRKAVKA